MAIIPLSGIWTWDATTFVDSTDPFQVGSGDWIRLDSDPNDSIFQVISVASSGVNIANPSGLPSPSGSDGTSLVTDPEFLGLYFETTVRGTPNLDDVPTPILEGLYFETTFPSGQQPVITLPPTPVGGLPENYFSDYIVHVWGGDGVTIRETYSRTGSKLDRPPVRKRFEVD